ncbi:MAG: CHAD domain-containing protein [Methanoregula sp.]|nr:CHAD domain-containing protein [Methanoregula sp.]
MPEEQVIPKTGLCWYGLQRLPPLLDAFVKEIDGVKTSEDIEYIHRMRVASRRLRAALPLFRPCFPRKQFRRWMQEITSITRALGEARDTDVQLTFLSKYDRKQSKKLNSRTRKNNKTSPATGPAIQFLMGRLQKRRAALQSKVSSALVKLEESGVIDEMRIAFGNHPPVTLRARKKSLAQGISPLAAFRIEKRLHTMLSYEHWIPDPDAVAEHHATRIAAKKLRYTIEVYSKVYRWGLKKILARVKKIQEILGDLHDCDVWIDQVTLLLLQERSLLRSPGNSKRPDAVTITSLILFLDERKKERAILHRKFMRYWETLRRYRTWDELCSDLEAGRKTRFRPEMMYTPAEAAIAVRTLALEYPAGIEHCRHVTDLSLMIFDQLQPLHQLGARERFLLESAGHVHDIGWKYGQKRHNIRSADMIVSDENLPFDIPERSIISLITLVHRGNTAPETSGFFRLLSPDNQKQVLVLAAILRLADGFDYLHLGSVQAVSCTVDEYEIIMTVAAAMDVSVEKERAGKKSDLFTRIFNRKLVIL